LREERSLGIRLAPGGGLSVAAERDDALRDGPRREDWRAPVGAALWVLAVAGRLWSVQEGSRLGRVLLGALFVLVAIASFEFAVAGRASAWVVCVPPLVLLACALASRYRARPRP
jgi:hypothetical protein